MSRRILAALCPVVTGLAAGCSATPLVPADPTWADVAPIFRGQCNSCHGWTAKETGSSYRFDFFDMTAEACGDAALALDKGLVLAGSPLATGQIGPDITPQPSGWARMPAPPSPALPAWERDTLSRWAARPSKGMAPSANLAPTLEVSGYPAAADQSLAFTVVLSDPDDDAALGVIEVNGLAFLMNRTGSFDVVFDSSSWSAGPQTIRAILCDGWAKTQYDFAPVQVTHPAAP